MTIMLSIGTLRLCAQQGADLYIRYSRLFINDTLFKKPFGFSQNHVFFIPNYSVALNRNISKTPQIPAANNPTLLNARNSMKAGFTNPFTRNLKSPVIPLNANNIIPSVPSFNALTSQKKNFADSYNSGAGKVSVPTPANALGNAPGTVGNQLNSSFSQMTGGTDAAVSQAKSSVKSVNDAVTKNFKALKKPAITANLTVENDALVNPGLLVANGSNFVNVLGVRGSLNIMGVPLSVNISNNQAVFNGQNPLGSSLYKFGFNPTTYSGMVQSQLQQYTNLRNTAFNGFNFTDYVRQTITEQVTSLQNGSGNLKTSPFATLLTNPEQLQQLMTLSQPQLVQKLRQMATQKNRMTPDGTAHTDSLIALQKKNNLKSADSLAQVISTVNKVVTDNGYDPKKLLLEENYLTGKTSPAFNSSETLSGFAEQKPANGFQSVLGGVRDLRVGSFGATLPGASGDPASQNKLTNGADLTFKVGYYPLTIGFGKLDDINAVKDAGFQNSIYVYPQNVTFLGAQLPKQAFGNVNVSVISSFSAQSNNILYSQPTLPGSSVAFTVTKSMNMESLGHLSVDVSKSSSLFDNSFEPGSEALLVKRSGGSAQLTENLFQSFSVGFKHNLNINELGASDNVYFNYAGLGYQNPANNGYSGASLKFGGDLKKSFNKNKLVLMFRSDFSNTPLSYTTNDKWKNYQVQFDGRYKVNKKWNLDIKYLASGTAMNAAGISNNVYNSQKLEMDATNVFKIGKNFSTLHISLADQSFQNSYLAATGSNMLDFSYIQTVAFKNSALTGTFLYNKELASSQLLGDMLTSEMDYQFKLSKEVQLSSGFNYLSNAAIARQAGIKQSIQVLAKKRVDISGSVNYLKNLITPVYADLYPSVRAELTVRYHFKIN